MPPGSIITHLFFALTTIKKNNTAEYLRLCPVPSNVCQAIGISGGLSIVNIEEEGGRREAVSLDRPVLKALKLLGVPFLVLPMFMDPVIHLI